MILQLYQEHGTITLVILEASTVRLFLGRLAPSGSENIQGSGGLAGLCSWGPIRAEHGPKSEIKFGRGAQKGEREGERTGKRWREAENKKKIEGERQTTPTDNSTDKGRQSLACVPGQGLEADRYTPQEPRMDDETCAVGCLSPPASAG